RLMVLAQTAVLTIDPELLQNVPLHRQGVESAPYQVIKEKLEKIKKISPQIKYIYTMTKTETEGVWQFIVDPDPVGRDKKGKVLTSFPGDRYDVFRFPEMLRAFEGPSADQRLHRDEWGVTLSGYAPVLDKEGKAVAMLGVDILAEDVYAIQREAERRVIFVFAFGVILALIVGGIISRTITRPVSRLVEGTSRIAQGNLQYRVHIDGDDEISDLARSFNQMARSLYKSKRRIFSYFHYVVKTLIRVLEAKDHYTKGHSQMVAEYAGKIALRMGVPREDIKIFKKITLLHDIGKVGIPDAILLKPGPLDDAEWTIMRQHPVLAFQLLAPIAFLRPALDIPYCHHEKWDGSGYPRRLKGEEIPLMARIFAVIDVWDALSSDRPYRPAWDKERVIANLREGAGTHFDPQVIAIFLGMEW
ncbi:MAG TPA: hypothetical protein DEB35_10045, partial [Desulfuromonas sp.]|nr:hypothetical protein [Desulfuromonas sp.]